MKKTVIIYGSSTGTCQNIAETIAAKLGIGTDNLFDASGIKAEKVNEYDNLLLGTSTWGDGELQDDWYDGLKVLKASNLQGKTVALFGCGDSDSYSDTFCEGIADLYDELKNSGCQFIGQVSTEGYSFSSSRSVVDGKFVGLALDDVNESDKTEGRINSWIENIKDAL